MKCFDFLQVFVPSFLYFVLFTFHIFFFTKLNMKTQFEIEFLLPNNGGKKVLEKYTANYDTQTFSKRIYKPRWMMSSTRGSAKAHSKKSISYFVSKIYKHIHPTHLLDIRKLLKKTWQPQTLSFLMWIVVFNNGCISFQKTYFYLTISIIFRNKLNKFQLFNIQFRIFSIVSIVSLTYSLEKNSSSKKIHLHWEILVQPYPSSYI